jgi:hypothetical protein
MSLENKISIQGSLVKSGFIWIAWVPELKLSAHALTPNKCIENLKNFIEVFNEGEPLKMNIEIGDNQVLVITSGDFRLIGLLESRMGKNPCS